MSHVTIRREIEAPAGSVWDLVANFERGLEPRAGVVHSEVEGGGVGCLRTTEFAGGDVLRECLEYLDERQRCYRVLVEAESIPVTNCRISAHVDELPGGRCRLEWDLDFEPEGITEARACGMIEGICVGFTNSIREIVEG
ncbi:MAG: SRPBCC family protein [Myxococcota bacterium]|nr:SRPBCC family protein [Myxococcota bacterium]